MRKLQTLRALSIAIAAIFSSSASMAGAVRCCDPCCERGMTAFDKPETLQVPPYLDSMTSLKTKVPVGTLASHRAVSTPSTQFAGTVPPGQWDDVDAYITFPYFFPADGEVDILLRGFAASQIGTSNEYRFDGWDRTLYWLETQGQPPRLLQALELTKDFVPVSGELFSDNPEVVSTCIPGAGCTVNFVAYFRYRQSNAAPNTFENLGGVFVTNAAGDAIDAVVLIENAQGVVTGAERLSVGDQIELNLLAYKIDEPDFIYTYKYMDFQTLDATTFISRRNYVPGVSFSDPSLPANLDAGNRPLRLILDASVGAADDYDNGGDRAGTFAYGGPYPLGFKLNQVQEFLHYDGVETKRAVLQAPPTPPRQSNARIVGD